jgi:hypothetical protein
MKLQRLFVAIAAVTFAAPGWAQTAPAAPATPAARATPAAAPVASASSQARAAEAAEADAQRAAERALANAAPGAYAAAEARAAAEAEAGLADAQRELQRASARFAELHQMMAQDQIEAALRRPVFARPMLGIVMGRDDGAGVKLMAVTPGSPAATAGLRSGDRLLRINGVAIDAANAEIRLAVSQDMLASLKEGEAVRLAWERDGKMQEIEVTAKVMPGMTVWNGAELERLRDIEVPLELAMDLGQLAPLAGCGVNGQDCEFSTFSEAWRWRGLQLAEVGPALGRYFGTDKGVLVIATPDDAMNALQPGDVIQQIDGEAVRTPQDAMRAMRGQEPGSEVEVTVLRDRRTTRASIEAPKRMRFAYPAPPAPPAPPALPRGTAPPAPPAPPAAMLQPPASPPSPPASTPPEPPQPPVPPRDERAGRGALEQVLG